MHIDGCMGVVQDFRKLDLTTQVMVHSWLLALLGLQLFDCCLNLLGLCSMPPSLLHLEYFLS